jgi:tRNA pseudouridine55 synthase
MYSAKKVGGRKLYELARRGETIERASVTIRIDALEALRHESGALLDAREAGTTDLLLRVVCSAGTYVRVLAEAVGERLGTEAHLVSLRRTRAGKFGLAAALTLEELEEIVRRGALAEHIISPAAALSELPSLHLTEAETRRTRHGAALGLGHRGANYVDTQPVCMLDEDGNLVAIGVYDEQSQSLRPRVGLAAEDD